MSNNLQKLLVSVMIPYYNCKDYIIETIESIENQTYPNIEIIVIDDGSDVEHAQYLESLLINKPAVKYERQNNQGVVSARNHAARLASGEYFLFLDADDIILPEYIEQAIKVLESDSNCKLVYPQAELFGIQNGKWELPEYRGMRSLLMSNRIPCIAIHRAVDFFKIKGFDESLKNHEDWDYWIRLLENGGEVFTIPKILFRYRKRYDLSSLTNQLSKSGFSIQKSWQQIYIKHNQLYLQHELGYFDLIHSLDYHQKKNKNHWLQKLFHYLKNK